MKIPILMLLVLLLVSLLNAEESTAVKDTTATGLIYHQETVSEEGVNSTIFLEYPVFEGSDPLSLAINRYVYDLINTGYTGPDGVRTEYTDFHLLAKDKVKAWAQNPDYERGIEWSISIEIIYDGELITLSTGEYGFSGGAHGYSLPSYVMFDGDGSRIDWKNLVAPENQKGFQQLLLANFEQPEFEGWAHDRAYILDPRECALTETGLLVMYEGCCYAEGYPLMLIPKEQIRPLLKEYYQKKYK